MKILGLDPGLVNTGWGLIEHQNNHLKFIASGTIQTSQKQSLSNRLVTLYEALQDMIQSQQPEQAAVEETFVNKNGQTTLKLGQARAISLLVPALNGLTVTEYSPNLVKKSVVGTGHADKNQIDSMVKILLSGAQPESEHEADALAVAICHAHHGTSLKEGKVA